MKVFIVHAHPESKSFNGSLTRLAKETLEAAGHEVKVSDLYAMKFDPVSDRRNFTSEKEPDYFKQQVEEMHASTYNAFSPDIAAEIEKLEWCDCLIFQFPLWWFGLPAILKGWVDRVFVMGRVYGGGKWYDAGIFQGKLAMLSVTTGGGESMYTETGLNGNINNILFAVNHGILRFVGFDVLPTFFVYAPTRLTNEQRQAYLEEYRQTLKHLQEITPISFPSLYDYDENFQLKK